MTITQIQAIETAISTAFEALTNAEIVEMVLEPFVELQQHGLLQVA